MKVKIAMLVSAVAAVVLSIVIITEKPESEKPEKAERPARIESRKPDGGGAVRSGKAAETSVVEVVERKGRRYRRNVKRNRAALAALRFVDSDHPYSERDKKVVTALEKASQELDAFDEDDFKLSRNATAAEKAKAADARKARERYLAAAAEAAKSSNPAVRLASVEAYSWHGSDLLSELTPMMADSSAEVAEAALDAVQTRLDEVEDPALRFEAASAYMSTMYANDEALEAFSSSMVASASDIIEADDDSAQARASAQEARDHVVDVLSQMIDSDNAKVVTAAKEAYQEITSEKWINEDEAKRWAMDPEGYEAP